MLNYNEVLLSWVLLLLLLLLLLWFMIIIYDYDYDYDYDLWLWLWLWLHIVWSSPVLFSQSCLSSNPAAYRHNTFRKIWAVPRMAGNCAFPKIFGRLNLPYQAFAFPEIVSSVPITMGFIVALVALGIFFISCARCLYFSTFLSSVVRILVR